MNRIYAEVIIIAALFKVDVRSAVTPKSKKFVLEVTVQARPLRRLKHPINSVLAGVMTEIDR
jgi:hypothetical protein